MRYDDFSHLNHQIAALSIRRSTMLRHFSLKLIWSRSYTVSEDILPSGLSSNWSPLWREISKNFSFTCRFIDPRREVSEADSSLLRSHARGGQRERWLATELLTLRTRSTICIASKGKTCHRRQPTGSRFQTWTTIQIYSNGTCSRGGTDIVLEHTIRIPVFLIRGQTFNLTNILPLVGASRLNSVENETTLYRYERIFPKAMRGQHEIWR